MHTMPLAAKAALEAVSHTLGRAGLLALRRGLLADDPALLQGRTAEPLPLTANLRQPIEGGCAICYAAWQAYRLRDVGEAQEFFAASVIDANRRLGGDGGGSRYLLNWWDDTPRAEAVPALLAEVEALLARHGGQQ